MQKQKKTTQNYFSYIVEECFRIMPGTQSALQGNSDFMNKIEAIDLKLVWRLFSLENESHC